MAGIILMLSLMESLFSIGAIQAFDFGHPATSQVAFDLTFVFVHLFLMVPVPVFFLSMSAVLFKSELVPVVFAKIALGLGISFGICGFAGLFSQKADNIGIALLSVQELWIVAIAIILLLQCRKEKMLGGGQK